MPASISSTRMTCSIGTTPASISRRLPTANRPQSTKSAGPRRGYASRRASRIAAASPSTTNRARTVGGIGAYGAERRSRPMTIVAEYGYSNTPMAGELPSPDAAH